MAFGAAKNTMRPRFCCTTSTNRRAATSAWRLATAAAAQQATSPWYIMPVLGQSGSNLHPSTERGPSLSEQYVGVAATRSNSVQLSAAHRGRKGNPQEDAWHTFISASLPMWKR